MNLMNLMISIMLSILGFILGLVTMATVVNNSGMVKLAEAYVTGYKECKKNHALQLNEKCIMQFVPETMGDN